MNYGLINVLFTQVLYRVPGLWPLADWQPDEAAVNRFAIPIPPDSLLRLPVIDAMEQGPDFVVVGRVQVLK